MIKCNCYSFNNEKQILIYGDELEIPESFGLTLIAEDIDPSLEQYRKLPLYNKELLILTVFGKRNREKVLEEEHISSFDDLSNAYFLLKIKQLNKSRRVREFVEQKYIEIIDLVKEHGCSEDIQSD